MGCLPYFKFYAETWLADQKVRTMSPAARGLYADLLAVAWNEGGIPADPSPLAPWLGISRKSFARLWAEIEGLWVHGADGQLVNPRQEQERIEAMGAHEKRVAAGRKGGRGK